MVLGVYRCSHSNAPSTTQSIKCNIQHSACSLHDIVRLLKPRPACLGIVLPKGRARPPSAAEIEAKAKVRIRGFQISSVGESGVANAMKNSEI